MFSFLRCTFALTVTALVFAADWPQLQRDAAKSGFQSETIATHRTTATGGYGLPVWSWNAPAAMSGQPVVGGGVVAIAVVTGRVFALEEATGLLRWSADLGEPVFSTLAIAGGNVIAATQGGRLVALSAASGAQVWVYAGAGKGYSASPAVDGGRVYIGSKDGRFHAVDAASGQPVWTFQVGGPSDAGAVAAPILASAAVRDGRVFFGAENMNAYALDATSGARLWRRALRGQSFGHAWPVASAQAGGVVLFRTTPVYAFHDGLNSDESHLRSATGTTGGTLGDKAAWIVEQRAVSQRLRDNPHRRSLWELNAATGADRYALPLPVVYTGGSGDVPAPPVVDDAANRAWIMTRSVYARFDGMGVRDYGEFAKLNLAFDPAIYTDTSLPEDRLGIRFFACRGSSNCKYAWEDFHKIADEGEVLTAASNAVLSSNWVSAGGIDLVTEGTFNVRFYSSDDTGGASLYGSQTGAVIANGRVILRDSKGVKSYAQPQ